MKIILISTSVCSVLILFIVSMKLSNIDRTTKDTQKAIVLYKDAINVKKEILEIKENIGINTDNIKTLSDKINRLETTYESNFHASTY